MIHVRFDGKSFDLDIEALGLRHAATDGDVKARLAEHLDVAVNRFDGYVIDRPDTGVLIVRPEAVYG